MVESDSSYWSQDTPARIYTAPKTPGAPTEEALAVFQPILSKLNPDMNDLQKATLLVHEVCSRYEYDYDRYHGLSNEKGFTWTNGKTLGVCIDYCNAVYAIFAAADIPVMRIIGITGLGSHAWNIAYLDGVWAIIDATAADVGYPKVMTFSEHEKLYDYDHSLNSTNEIRVAQAIIEAHWT